MTQEQNSEETISVEDVSDLIGEEEAVILNKKVACITGDFFKALAKMSNEEIYDLAFTEAGKESPLLLELINEAYTEMLTSGGDLPRLYFNSYERLVESFVKTFSFNLNSKLEANRDVLIAKVIGKTESPDRISHKDIIDALSK